VVEPEVRLGLVEPDGNAVFPAYLEDSINSQARVQAETRRMFVPHVNMTNIVFDGNPDIIDRLHERDRIIARQRQTARMQTNGVAPRPSAPQQY
jgi:hypothetical protein